MKKVVLLVFILMMIGSGTFVFFESSYFQVQEVVILGDGSLVEYEILEYAQIKRTMNLVMIDTGLAQKNLSNHPMIKTATVEKRYPNQIIIDYTVREPILAVFYSNSFIAIDQNLVAMAVNQNESGLLAVYGLEIESFNLGKKIEFYNENLMDATIDLVKLIGISDLNFIPSIHIIENEVVLRIHEDFHVNFGNGKNIENRFNSFFNIYQELHKQQVNQGIIDVSTDGLATFKPFGN